MESLRNQALTFQTLRGAQMDPATLVRVTNIIPNDELKRKRLANLSVASHVVLASDLDGRLLGVAYVRTILGIPNVTWIVVEAAQRRGIASRLVAEVQKHFTRLTAICRNEPSVRLARKSGFRMILGRFAIWTAPRLSSGRSSHV